MARDFHPAGKYILLASGLLFALHISLPAVAGFLVLYARQIGIENFAWYYVVSGATSLIARPLLGWASDKIGRGAAIAVGFSLEALALCVIVNASTLAGMLVSGVFYMTGSAIGTAATLALALELPWWREILNVLDREIILASTLSFFSHVTFPAVASFLVLYARDIGVDNIGWFYAASGATSILARPLLGKVSDKIGRRRALLAGFVLQALAVMISGVLYMLGLAMSSLTTMAIAMEQAKPERRGHRRGRALDHHRQPRAA